MELLTFTSLDTLPNTLSSYRDLSLISLSTTAQLQRILTSDHPPHALYLDDSRSVPPADLWKLIELAQAAHVKTLVNGFNAGTAVLNDARALGIATLSERNPEAIAAWIGQQLQLTVGSRNGQVPVLAIGAAKGGIGKTFASCVLAEGFRRRGMNVLVWDSDISNPGLVPAFRIPASAPSYLNLVKQGPAQWNPTGFRPFIFQPDHTQPNTAGWGRVDFLVGSHTVAKAENDVRLPDWQGLYAGVTQVEGYDLILIDTPPDYLRRPYATHALQSGGFVVLPCPPGARERMGVGHMLDHFREHAPDKLDHCALLFMEPEKGVMTTVKEILPVFARRYPDVKALGTLPRAPRLASMADEHDGYISMFDLGPKTPFAAAAHRIVDNLATTLGITPKLAMPKGSWWAALRGNKPDVPPANTSLNTLAGGA